jgi:hypothetical protein
MFWELSKRKPLLRYKIIKTPSIWHLFHYNLLEWDWQVVTKDKFADKLGAFMWSENFNNITYCTFDKFM